MRYHVYKKSINEYRILDTYTNQLIDGGKSLLLVGALFMVDHQGYREAQNRQFENTGNPLDYFAWIETDHVYLNRDDKNATKQIYFNPFKGDSFKYRETDKPVVSAPVVQIEGNLLKIR